MPIRHGVGANAFRLEHVGAVAVPSVSRESAPLAFLTAETLASTGKFVARERGTVLEILMKDLGRRFPGG